jgi:hypothetical protein
MAVHRPHSGCDHGGDQVSLPRSLEKSGSGTAPPVAVTRRCIAVITAVNTGHSGDTLSQVASRPRLGGHCPRGGGATRQGAVPHLSTIPLASSADHRHRAWRCPRASIPSLATPPFLHLFHHLRKCANTPSVSPSRASVLAFSQSISMVNHFSPIVHEAYNAYACFPTPSGPR